MKRSLLQAACVAIPKGLGGVLTIVLNGVLITRMSPAEFGIYAVCLALVALADGVIGGAVDMTAVKLASARRLRDLQAARDIERWALLVKLGFSALVICALLPFAGSLSEALFHREQPGLLLVALATAAGVLLLRSAFLHLQMDERFGAYAGLELLAQTLRVLGIVCAITWFGSSVVALTAAALIGTVVAVAAGALAAGGLVRGGVLRWADGHELWRTLRWMAVTLALSAVLARLDLLLLTRWSSIEQVGLFAAAQVFAQIPELFGWYLAVVYGPKVMPAAERGTLRAMMRRVQTGLFLMVVAAAAATALALSMWGHLLPAPYTHSGEILLPLMAGALAGMFALPVTVPYVMFVRPNYLFLYDLLTLPLLLLAYQLAITSHGALGAAWVSGGARIVKAAVLQSCALLWAKQHATLAPATP
jgi:O-antigen/teichoic acid export membrane protein